MKSYCSTTLFRLLKEPLLRQRMQPRGGFQFSMAYKIILFSIYDHEMPLFLKYCDFSCFHYIFFSMDFQAGAEKIKFTGKLSMDGDLSLAFFEKMVYNNRRTEKAERDFWSEIMVNM